MEIRAQCKFDKDSIRALAHLSTFKKSNPKKTVITRIILCFILLLIIVAELIAFDFNVVPIILIVIDLLVISIDCFMYFGLPKIQYKGLAKLKDAENEYIFYDNVLKAFTKSEEYSGEAEIEYSLFVKVYETSRYLFLYQTNNQVFIVDKNTIEGGTIEDIRNKFSIYVKDKYIICKY